MALVVLPLSQPQLLIYPVLFFHITRVVDLYRTLVIALTCSILTMTLHLSEAQLSLESHVKLYLRDAWYISHYMSQWWLVLSHALDHLLICPYYRPLVFIIFLRFITCGSRLLCKTLNVKNFNLYVCCFPCTKQHILNILHTLLLKNINHFSIFALVIERPLTKFISYIYKYIDSLSSKIPLKISPPGFYWFVFFLIQHFNLLIT